MRGTASSSATAAKHQSSLIAQIRRIPLLDAQQEHRLAMRWHRHGDRAAADRLVTSHLRLVAKIAWGYRGYGLPMSDLISEGSLGMLEAVKRFDPERGFRLSSYAPRWIRSQIRDYVLRSWSLGRVGTRDNQRKLFFNLRRLKAQLGVIEGRNLSPEEVQLIAVDLGVSTADVLAVSWRLSSPDATLNIQPPDNDDEWQDQLVEESCDQESALVTRETFGRRRALLRRALALPSRASAKSPQRRMAAGIGGTVRFAGIVLGFAAVGALLFAIIVRDLSKLAAKSRSLAQQLMS